MSDPIVCPSCENKVEPVLRRLPGEPDEKGRVGKPLLAFANVCPMCSARLDATIEKAKRERTESEPTRIDVPASNVQTTLAPVQIRQTKPKSNDEDLFVRIRREHEEVCREEQELKTRLAQISERRETLDSLIAAMNGMRNQIAAE